LDIVGLGLSTLDVLIRLKDMPTWERPGDVSAFGLDGGGPVGTACVAAARLGARVGYIGTAGNDISGELKVRFFRESGVDLSHLVFRDRPESQVIFVYVHEETGERIFSALKGFSEVPLSISDLDRDYITAAEYLHLDGFHFEAALTAARWMREAGKKVSLDCARTDGGAVGGHLRALLPYVNILICGSGFCQSLTGERDLWKAEEAVLGMGPQIAVQTEGAEGSYTLTARERFHTPAFQVEVLDTTGAGDVFHGAYLVGLLRGWDLQTAARFSAAVSAIKCRRLGGRRGIPTFEEAMSFLGERGF